MNWRRQQQQHDSNLCSSASYGSYHDDDGGFLPRRTTAAVPVVVLAPTQGEQTPGQCAGGTAKHYDHCGDGGVKQKKKNNNNKKRKHRISFLFLCLFVLLPASISWTLIVVYFRKVLVLSRTTRSGIIIPQEQQGLSWGPLLMFPTGGSSSDGTGEIQQRSNQHSEDEEEHLASLDPAPHEDDYHKLLLDVVSIVILTHDKQDALAKLLSSVISQKGITFEIIIVDSGCKPKTERVVQDAFDMMIAHNNSTTAAASSFVVAREYVKLCDNPGYGVSNNEGVKKSSNETKWILFLNDDIVLKDEYFTYHMIHLGNNHEEAAAVGCVLTSAKGDKLIEAGSIVWNDGSAAGFGRGRKDLDAPEFSYPKPVDYVSGACLMVDKGVFLDYGGFDHEHFPNYYEDTDLQMHIQHDLGKEVWLQPLSIAHHEEHGSFGEKESLDLMTKSRKIFFEKWKKPLQNYHLPIPYHLPRKEQDTAFQRAGDLRGRKSDKASILYIDGRLPNKDMGSGFGRAFDNLSVLASLGYRITAVSLEPVTDKWCNVKCLNDIRQLGIEVVTSGLREFYVAKDRPELYNIVIVSRPGTFLFSYKKLQRLFSKSPFAMIYDSEALTYRRDEMLIRLVKEDRIMFPGRQFLDNHNTIFSKRQEITMLSMADYVLTVSTTETELVKQHVANSSNAETIGHIMDLTSITKKQFSQRSGILFIGSFHDSMYYNGDAIWYFLHEIYPLVLRAQQEAAKAAAVATLDDHPQPPMRLTIAGRKIPMRLIRFVISNATLANHVTFLESPKSIDSLMENARVFIAPHQYGSGIQYKVSNKQEENGAP
mmetsp:Transcript_7463/g.14124  ORF Transcript_7463/g.14124 Transcript_7463/m.14124 type:complete len:819 (-) Transcript_7463:1552-4008(-)